MKRFVFAVIAPIVMSMLLVACGGGGSAGGSAGAANITPLIDKVGTVAGAPKPDIPVDDMGNEYETITDISDGGGEDVILSGLAFLKNDALAYERKDEEEWGDEADDSEITLLSITAPVVKLSFDTAGDISQVVAYVDNEYTAAATTSSSTNFMGTDSVFEGTDNGVTITAERGADFFGFDSNYMAYVSWSLKEALSSDNTILEDTINDIDGVMLAGIETTNLDNISGSITFVGKGQGTYIDKDVSYKTIFDVEAAVDFTARTIGLTTTTTSCENDCGGFKLSKLDLALVTPEDEDDEDLALSFADGNNISTVIAGDFEGRLDARFYGAAAQEFGGTFALKDGNDYYYGAFGAERGESDTLFAPAKVITISALNTVNVSGAPSVATPSASLTLSATNNETVTLQGLAVAHKDIADYARATTATAWTDSVNLNIDRTITPSHITASAVSFTFGNGDGTISDVTAYADDDYTDVAVDRSTIFGFASDYMAYISWGSSQDVSDLSSSETTGTLTHIDGAMLAGIETTASNIFSAGKIDFTGKGSGIYGTKNGRYDTSFTVKAAVDFGDDSIKLSTDTACVDCGNFDASKLNFTNLSLSFANGYIISEDVTLDSSLEGKLDVRFYGGGAQEFGGAFALAQVDTRYYYGVFGATRNDITPFSANNSTVMINAVDTEAGDSTKTPDIGTYTSLKAVSTAANGGSAIDVTLQGLTVLVRDIRDYGRYDTNTAWTDTANIKVERELTPLRITASAVDLTFGTDGNASATTIYVGDEYVAATVDRSAGVFGFASDYMAYVSWNSPQTVSDLANSATTDTLTDIDGAMIAGIQTNDGDIPTGAVTAFTGKGKGTYGSLANKAITSYNTEFSIIANVNFTARSVDFETNGTNCIGDNCSNVTVPSFLNFTATNLGFANSTDTGPVNKISDTITAGGLTGMIDARFYGNEGDGANEFGGTFALANITENNERYYYGAFGAERGNIDPFAADKTITLNALDDAAVAINQQSTNIGAYASLSAITADNITLQGLTVALDDTTKYSRPETTRLWTDDGNRKDDRQITAKRITSSAVDITFAGGVASATTIYAEADYTSGNTDSIAIDRSTIFGFDSDYMAYISWGEDKSLDTDNGAVAQTVADIDGMMIAGIQTDNSNIFNAGKVKFTGKGAGTYGTKTDEHDTEFTVTAEVDFTADEVDITTSATACTANCTNFDVNNHSYFNFTTGAISVAGNSISADLTLDNTLTGKLDARFYGGATQEFGGAFALAEAETRYYYGAFGTTRNGVAPFVAGSVTTLNALDTEAAANPTATVFDTNTYSNLTDVNNATVTLQGLAVSLSDVTDYKRYTTDTAWTETAELNIDKQITPKIITSSAVSLAFDGSNVASATTIFADIDYTASNTDSITVDRSMGTFGFATEYMAAISWSQNETVADDLDNTKADTLNDFDGIMLAGVEAGSIPDANIVSIDFEGKGAGEASGIGATNFDVTATVHFSSNEIMLATENTQGNGSAQGDLDFSTTLTYAKATGDVTGTVTNVDGMDGTVDARFYGTGTLNTDAAEEFGGTFALADTTTNNYYYGWFGATSVGYTRVLFDQADDSLLNFATSIYDPTLTLSHTETASNIAGIGTLDRASSENSTITMDVITAFSNDNILYNNKDTKWSYNKYNATQTINVVGLSGGAASIDFNSGNISEVKLYIHDGSNDATYTANGTGDETADSFSEDITGTDADSATINVLRNAQANSIFGFDSENIAYISWHINKTADLTDANAAATATSYDIDGMMVAGLQTLDANITETGSANFSGKGRGYLNDDMGNRTTTIFDIDATVGFTGKTVSLATSNSIKCDIDFANCEQTETASLNFKTTSAINYETSNNNVVTNNISGDIINSADDNTGFTGTVDARFYGKDYFVQVNSFTRAYYYNASEEFAGSFAMTNDANHQYYGIFGADIAIAELELETETGPNSLTVPTVNETNKKGLTSFSSGAANQQGVTLPVASIVQITNRKGGITTEKISGGVVTFSYKSGNFDVATPDEGLYVYVGKNAYYTLGSGGGSGGASNGSGNEYIVGTGGALAQGLNVSYGPQDLSLDRRSAEFGFTATYMARAYWKAKEGDDLNIYGYGIAGYETVDSAIPGADVTFTGKGEGIYSTGNGNTRYNFNITATVDFANNKVVLASTNTSKADLNFTGELSYAVATENGFSGAITTIGTDNDYNGTDGTELTGTADGKFYGPAAQELGGTFSMANSTAGYVGFFGAKKP